MIKNYLKIAFRNLWRRRVFSFINVMGSAVGMTACFLIFLYARFELSHDPFHTKAAFILANLIALFTISFRAITEAITNPVKSLRTE